MTFNTPSSCAGHSLSPVIIFKQDSNDLRKSDHSSSAWFLTHIESPSSPATSSLIPWMKNIKTSTKRQTMAQNRGTMHPRSDNNTTCSSRKMCSTRTTRRLHITWNTRTTRKLDSPWELPVRKLMNMSIQSLSTKKGSNTFHVTPLPQMSRSSLANILMTSQSGTVQKRQVRMLSSTLAAGIPGSLLAVTQRLPIVNDS